jgi:hypothetical protein
LRLGQAWRDRACQRQPEAQSRRAKVFHATISDITGRSQANFATSSFQSGESLV